MMRRFLFGLAVFCLGLSLASALPARLRVRMGTLAPSGSTWHQLLKEMGFKWKQATDGAVDLKIYAGGVVGGEDEMIRKMRIGQLQAAAISNAGLAEVERSAYALMIPMMFDSYEEWDFVRASINPYLEEKLREQGFVVLTWSDVGWVYFFTTQPLRRAEELKERKMGASPTETATVEIMKWAGLNPVPISIADTATGLQTGLIDTVYLPIIFTQGSQLYRDARNMTDLKWVPLQGALVMTAEAFEKFPEDVREEILAAAREIGQRLRRDTRRQEEEALQTMLERGLEVWPVDEAGLQEWRELAMKAYPKIRGELVPPEVFDRVQKLRDEYRASQRAQQ